jgi:hypothetical protein
VSALAIDRPGVNRPGVGRRETGEPASSLLDHVGGEPTLDEVLSGAWQGLAAHQHVACPVCGGEMVPEYGVHARPIGGRCRSCETQLS